MYNVTEPFAELNQANVAQATKLSALALENADKLAKINLQTGKSPLAQGVENAQAVAAVRTSSNSSFEQHAGRSERAGSAGLLEAPVRTRHRSAGEVHGADRGVLGGLHQGRGRVGRPGEQVGAGRIGNRRRRVQAGWPRRWPRSTSSSSRRRW
ncbi:MAG: phasin family protein [Betaproteobacteria bacterium]|nr:phasin family protein [Betaproteobacteria bacterium]